MEGGVSRGGAGSLDVQELAVALDARDLPAGEGRGRRVIRLEGGDRRHRQPRDPAAPEPAVEALSQRLDLGQLRHDGCGYG